MSQEVLTDPPDLQRGRGKKGGREERSISEADQKGV